MLYACRHTGVCTMQYFFHTCTVDREIFTVKIFSSMSGMMIKCAKIKICIHATLQNH